MTTSETPVRLKRWLKRNGKTQHWLATQIGVTDSNVSQIINGKIRPSLNVAAGIERVTGIPAREFAEVA